MSTSPHPAAPHTLPFYLPGPDGSDPVLVGTGVFLILALLAFGLLFLRLHTLPERLAHRGKKFQFEIVAVLGLIALLTHMHIFWVLGLVLALIDLPDVTGPMRRIAGAAERLAGLPPGGGDPQESERSTAETTRDQERPHDRVAERSRTFESTHGRHGV